MEYIVVHAYFITQFIQRFYANKNLLILNKKVKDFIFLQILTFSIVIVV